MSSGGRSGGTRVRQHGTAAITPNDPVWDQSWGEQRVGMANAWDITKGDPKRRNRHRVDTGSLTGGSRPSGPARSGLGLHHQLRGDAGHRGPRNPQRHDRRRYAAMMARGAAGYCWRCDVMPVRVAKPQVQASTQAWRRSGSGGPSITVHESSRSDGATRARTRCPSRGSRLPLPTRRSTACLCPASAGNTGRPSPDPSCRRSRRIRCCRGPIRTAPSSRGRPTVPGSGSRRQAASGATGAAMPVTRTVS